MEEETMSLFVVIHQHSAETCPARDPQGAQFLLHHLSGENAKKAGVTIRGEAVANGAHRLYLVVESRTEPEVQKFMEPFRRAGSVEVLPASTCSSVAGRGGC